MTTEPHSAAAAAEQFEARHRTEREPWMFAERAAEILRHEWIVETARSLAPRSTLDVGCTAGQLTEHLARALTGVMAVDVSPTAVANARRRIDGRVNPVTFLAGSVLSLPVAASTFDLIVAADGLYSWNLSEDDRAQALTELHRVLESGGCVILTEHMRPVRFREFVREVEASPLAVRAVEYLYDRPWYQFESWFRAIQPLRPVRWLRRNVAIARVLSRVGRVVGPSASRHICIIAEKRSA